MKNPFLFSITILFFLTGCSDSGQINELKFPYKKNYQAVFFTQSSLYREDGSIRTSQSDSIYLTVNNDLSEKGSLLHEWFMLPGSKDKNIPDTVLSLINETGLYHYYGPDLLPEGAKEIKLIELPLQAGKMWESSYLSFPAKAMYLPVDSLVTTPAGDFSVFSIQYDFSPYYMNELILNDPKSEVRGVLTDYYSPEHGKVLSLIDYFVTDPKSGKRKWKILANRSALVKLTIPN